MFLYSKRIYVREPAKSDAVILSKTLSCDEIYSTTYNIPRDFTISFAKWWVEFVKSGVRNKTGFEFLIFDYKNQYIGNCAVNNINKTCNHGNLTYLIAPKFWNQGFATEAALLMLNFGFEKLELERISGICMAHNTASEKVLLNVGFKYEGLARHEIIKDGKYIDVKHYGIIKDDFIRQKN